MARQFTDNDDGVELAQDTFSSSSKLTLFAWVRLNSLGAFQTIWGRRSGNSASFQFRINNTDGPGFSWTQGTAFQTYSDIPGVTLSTGVWYALAVSFDWAVPNTVSLWIDGVEYARSRSGGSGASPANPNTPITIGRYAASGHPLKGQIAFPARWGRILSAEEHQQMAAGFYPKHIGRGLVSLPDLERGVDTVVGQALTFTDAPAVTPNPRIYA